jgi:Carboxypeptidase regulatory-like domain
MCAAKLAVISVLLFSGHPSAAAGQETVCGSVKDQTGAAIADARVELRGGGSRWNADSDSAGEFCFQQIASGSYELVVKREGFKTEQKEVTVFPGESLRVAIMLAISTARLEVTVVEGASDPASLNVAETKFNTGLIEKLPSESVNAAMSSVLTLATPGVAADSNGVFHPLGEHAETSFSVDGQPISDQQSRIFSNQISLNTIEEMRTIQGAPPAEYGDKTSLIVEARTKSGLDAGRTKGTVSAGYGSFDTPVASATFSWGTQTVGNFFAADGINSHRFLDSPEFQPLHANGNAANAFDRFDWRPSDVTAIHLNLSAAHSWFQVPNTYNQQYDGQDQRQHMSSFNAGLAFSRLLTSSLVLTANTWVRQDLVNYYPSANLVSDRPATLSQSRRLTSTGLRTDLAYSHNRHTVKGGLLVQVTPISEAFQTGLTDPAFNSPCVDAEGTPVPNPALISGTQCASAGYSSNPGFQAALLPYDLTRGGSLFQFHGRAVIKEESAYLQDSIKLGELYFNLGLRYDHYDGLSHGVPYPVQRKPGALERDRSGRSR